MDNSIDEDRVTVILVGNGFFLSLVFNGISTFMGYLVPKPSL